MALNIERINSKLEGEFFFKGKKWSVPFTVTGDAVQFKLVRRGRKLSLEILHIEKSDQNSENLPLIDPFCTAFGKCGGCRGQHLDYEFQIQLKTDPVISAMKQNFNINPEIIPAPELKGHRHRMDFTVNGKNIGFRPAGDFSKIIDIEDCPVQSENANITLKILRDALMHFPDVGFNRDTLSGIIKYATIRWGSTGSLILTCDENNFSKEESILSMNEFKEFLLSKIKSTVGDALSLVVCTSKDGSEVSCPPGGSSEYGPGSFQIELGGQDFSIPYDSFFQPNPRCFNALIEWSLRELVINNEEKPQGELLDFYSGSGILSSIFAHKLNSASGHSFESICGYDFIASAIENAKGNFKNFSGNVEFKAVDLNNKFGEEQNPFKGNISLILADPPRAGLSPSLIKNILTHSNAPLFLYISCNPESQIRDLLMLKEKYTVASACIADCFPHTGHLEQAVLLKHTR